MNARMDYESLMSKVDARIAELEARRKKAEEKKYHVGVMEGQGDRMELARMIAAVTGEGVEDAAKRLQHPPVDVAFRTKDEALKFARDITNAGGKAGIRAS